MANIQEKTTVNSIYVRTSDGVDCTQLCRIGRNGLDVFLGISVTDGEPDGIYAVRQGCWMDDFAYMAMKSFGPEIFSRAANYTAAPIRTVYGAHIRTKMASAHTCLSISNTMMFRNRISCIRRVSLYSSTRS